MIRLVALGTLRKVALLACLGLLCSCKLKPPPADPLFDGKSSLTNAPAAAPSPSPSPSPSPVVQLVPARSPEEAANALLQAWRAGDRSAAARVAESSAVDALFAHPPGSTQGRGCDEATAERNCVYRLGNGLVRLGLAQSGSGWIVNQVDIS
jgi:hypothetical protein